MLWAEDILVLHLTSVSNAISLLASQQVIMSQSLHSLSVVMGGMKGRASEPSQIAQDLGQDVVSSETQIFHKTVCDNLSDSSMSFACFCVQP